VEKSAGDRYRFVHADICDLAALEEALGGHDAVVHFAAESHVDRSISGPEDFAMTNCVGTNMVMQAARRLGIERVVHISTDEVYGSVPTAVRSRQTTSSLVRPIRRPKPART